MIPCWDPWHDADSISSQVYDACPSCGATKPADPLLDQKSAGATTAQNDSDVDQPRQWWIDPKPRTLEYSGDEALIAIDELPSPGPMRERLIHVIEYAAYERLRAELEALTYEHTKEKSRRREAEAENAELKAEDERNVARIHRQSAIMADVERDRDRARAELSREKEYSAETHARFEEQNNRITELEAELAELKVYYDDLWVQTETQRLEELVTENQLLEYDLTQARAEIAKAKHEIEQMNNGRPSEWAYSILREERDGLKAKLENAGVALDAVIEVEKYIATKVLPHRKSCLQLICEEARAALEKK